MGRVWVAREENTGRLFAIKTTLSDEKAGGEFWNVLLDEARIAAQVQHRSVCTIHAFEVDEQRGVPYLVMDFSDGGSLHELLEACSETPARTGGRGQHHRAALRWPAGCPRALGRQTANRSASSIAMFLRRTF